ncbi:phage baseplate upper protein [Mammaliicoccus sciuri]|uniref:Phage baseplate upper protein n=1 Tax=Mammaliicoccus sciuri TaxID=1296 RepID=A0AB37HKH2_MAMSC|nr:phage baseplate upper protein [Mammaliicoccus sciuri]QRN90718.1 phage baseplate upper protein [Mammaliicoccus sciuri]
MALNKIARTQLDTTAYYQKLLDLNVRFFVNDDNTAILEFPITRHKKPVPLSDVNVKSYIAIITPDGSHKIDYLEFHDELNGVLRYTLPNDVLAQVGKHHAQVYISVNGVNDVVVERKIAFNVEDDYINSIDTDTKLSYIRMFDDLYAAIQQRVVDIENAINNAADYVTQITEARDQAYVDITNLVNQTKQEIETAINNYKSEILQALNESESTIEARSEYFIQQVENAKTEVTQAISNAELVKESRVRELIANLQSKEEAETSYSNFLAQAKNYVDSVISNEVGSSTVIPGLDFNDFNAYIQKSGNYYYTGGLNVPGNFVEGFVKYSTKTSDDTPEIVKGYIEIIPKNNSKYVYASWINSGVIAGWKKTFRIDLNEDLLTKNEVNSLVNNSILNLENEMNQAINNNYSDTGWVDITLINGAIPYNSNTVPKVKLLTINGTRIISIKGVVKGMTSKGSIGVIPKSMADYIVDTRSYVQNTSIDNNITNFNRFSLVSNGEVRLDASTLNPIKDTHWIPLDVTILL